MIKLKILVIGGTRFFGIDIVNLLLKAGHRVSILSDAETIPKFIDKVKIFKGDRHNFSLLKEIANQTKFDFIVDNIAFNKGDVTDCLSIFRGKVNHYILTSSAWVYKILKPFGRSFKEDDLKIEYFKKEPRRKLKEITLNYITGKLACEKALISQSSVKYTIFRPCMVTGSKDHNLRAYFYFQRLMDGGKIILLKEDGEFQLLYKEDVAEAYWRAIESMKSINQVFNLAPSDTISVKKFIEISAQVLNVKPNFCVLSEKELEVAAPDYLKNEPFNFEKDIYDSTKIKQKLNVSFRPYKEWIKDTAIWYRDNYSGQDSAGYSKRKEEINLCS